MNLKSFVGKTVLLQFKRHESWIMAHAPGGHIDLVEVEQPVKAPDGTMGVAKSFVNAPFLLGKIQEADGHVSIVVDSNGGKVQVLINPDVVSSVTIAVEAPSVLLVGGG